MAASLLRNISWLGFASTVVKPIWFVFVIYVCYQTMGTEQYGVMTASMALMTILGGIASVGTSQYTIREVARDHVRASAFLTNLFPIRLLLGISCLGLGLIISMLLNSDAYAETEANYSWAYLFAGIYALTLNLTEYCRSFYRAREVLRDEAISIIIEKILTVSLGTLILLQWPYAAGALAGIAAGMTITLILNIYWLQRSFATFSFPLFDQSFIRKSIKEALPLGLVGIFVLVYFKTDSVMLQSIQGDTVTGQYGVAFRILEALLLFPGIIVAVLLPRLSTLFVRGIDNQFKHLLKKSSLILVGFSIIVAGVLSLGASMVIGFIEPGPSAVPAAKALQILVWTFPFASVNYLFSTALTATDDQVAIAWILGLAVVFNIALNAILIPTYSLYGASAATLLTQAIVLASMVGRYFVLIRRR